MVRVDVAHVMDVPGRDVISGDNVSGKSMR
jgi:hypothetical protein